MGGGYTDEEVFYFVDMIGDKFMEKVKMIGLKIVVETDDGKEEIEIKEPDTKYWDAVKKLLEDSFTTIRKPK